MAKGLTDIMNIFKDEAASQLGFELDDLVIFRVRASDVYLAYKIGETNPVLREVDLDKLRLALHLANQMREAKDHSLISPNHSNKIKSDVANLQTRLKDISWLQKK